MATTFFSEGIANIDEYRWTLANVYGTLFLVKRVVDGARVDEDGKKPETIQRMIDVLRELDEGSLLALGYAFASLVFTAEGEREWLIERFFTVQDILGESWVFQELIKDGEKQRLEKDLLQFVEIRFPTLLAQAKQTVEQQTPLEQLQTMLNKLYRANTIVAAQVALLADG